MISMPSTVSTGVCMLAQRASPGSSLCLTMSSNSSNKAQTNTRQIPFLSNYKNYKSALFCITSSLCSIFVYSYPSSFFNFFSSQTIHNQILQEYHKIKKVCLSPALTDFDGMKYQSRLSDCDCAFSYPLQTNPNYSLEKNRCEYLHNKLAHIKRLIAEYDQQQL